MFTRTRTRLTVSFTGLLLVFLTAFTIVSYFSFSFLLYRDAKHQIVQLAEKEAAEHRHDLLRPNRKSESIDYHPENRSFYYVINSKGALIDGDESNPAIREEMLRRLSGWYPVLENMRMEEFHTEGRHKTHMIITGKSLYRDEQLIGVVYAGEDVTQLRNALQQMMITLGIAAVLFAIISAVLGYYMAGRAMRPIIRSFARQREFVADASHELRTPLTILHSSLEVLDSEEREHISSFSKQVMDDMKEEVKRMRSLVSDLLTLARADSGSLSLIRETFDLRLPVEQLVRSFQPLFAKKQQTFEWRAPETFTVHADKERIMQLLCILLDNASKYTPVGGQISLELYEAGSGKERMACIRIRDTGIGIPPEEQKRIFDRFYRIDKARSREDGSTGLGLSIADWIVRMHEGVIHIQSEVGVGSTFTVQFPLLSASQANKK
ncbi:sensor histidine kinase [Aneurinibacillus sp. REN35]|uniref:sensor histidine kinase n=1 Tax=Aneurinibacillus sp. REN35 TaxID=3237286 RepID=UPI0035287575